MSLVGARSSFEDALARASAIAVDASTVVVTGVGHCALVVEQLARANVTADILLEPTARDSAAAMAAAAVFVAERDPDAIMVVLSADHHIPDVDRFRADVFVAATGAQEGYIVTLGVPPTEASTAFGYIRSDPALGNPRPIQSFVEKPGAALARQYVDEGYLWNSGMFVVSARTLLAELEAHAPAVLAQVRGAVASGRRDGALLHLDASFNHSPKISIDFAVMEKTRLAAVVTAGFGWSDLGAWDAVWRASSRDSRGNAAVDHTILIDSHDVLARGPDDVRIAVVGVSNVAVIVDRGSVLVCHLDHSQSVKTAVERVRTTPPRVFGDLAAGLAWLDRWMTTSALPLWWAVGADHARGGFLEALSLHGDPLPGPRRARVQARQVYVYATAGAVGWTGPWRAAVAHGLDYLEKHFRREDGLYRTWVSPDGRPVPDEIHVYDQAFVLLALASAQAVTPDDQTFGRRATDLLAALEARAHPTGGYRESGPRPFQANAHMHLFESALAWCEIAPEPWGGLADRLGEMAMTHFFDHELGVLREAFDSAWNVAPGLEGQIIEPGHQFEWAWLFSRWASLRGADHALPVAGRLFASGQRGVDQARGVAMNELTAAFSNLDAGARLWPQTERLRTSLLLGDTSGALEAVEALYRYFDTPAAGTWRDKLRSDSSFVAEPSPASSLYHIVSAWRGAKAPAPSPAV